VSPPVCDHLEPSADLDFVLPASTGHEPAPRWIAAGHERLTGTEWKDVLRACRAAVRTARAGFGPRTAGRAAALELPASPNHVRLAAAAVLASHGAKQLVLIELGGYWDELEVADRLGLELRAWLVTPRQSTRKSCDSLPVEAARAVPILVLLERYGIICRQVGREYLGRCPFGDHHRPHLTVNAQKGLWHCWPCDLGGDGIAFVVRLKGLTFAQAVRELAA
jgi:hypothetical protein